MNARRAIFAAAALGALLTSSALLASDKEELLRVWSLPKAPVWERADAVNRSFTNRTPVTAIVAVLGTNYTHWYSPISTVWLGPGPEPPKTSGLKYRFGGEYVIVHTTADLSADPLTGRFTRASAQTTNGVWVGQPGSAANRSQPVWSETNRTAVPAGSGR